MRKRLECPKCGSYNINIEYAARGTKYKTKGPGLAGHAYNIFWFFFGIATYGLGFLFLPRAKKSRKVAICQDCGYDWGIKTSMFD